MIYEELKTAFRIYDRLDKQNRFVKGKNEVHSYHLITPRDTPLPFQFRVPVATGGSFVINGWKVRRLDDTVAYDLNGAIGLLERKRSSDGYEYITYYGGRFMLAVDLTLEYFEMAEGWYYLEIIVNGKSYFSEVFYVPCDAFSWTNSSIPYTKLEWSNDGCDLGPILYQTGWKNVVFLESSVSKEEPSIEEEGYEDGLKNFMPSLQKYVDNLVIEDLLPFYLADAMVLMTLHKKINVILPKAHYSSQMRNAKATVTINELENLYNYVLKFQQDTQYLNTSCCDKMQLVDGCNSVIANATAAALNDADGTIAFTWDIVGNDPDEIRVKDVALVQPPFTFCQKRADEVLPGSTKSFSLYGFPNGTHTIDIIPVCTLFGIPYEGTKQTITVVVTGSAVCVI